MRSVSLPSVPADSAEPAAHVPGTLVYASPQMHEILSLVGRVATGDAKVLITGESGVGKDLIAREIHARSVARAARVHRGELRRPDRDAARVRAVRSREGQLHRRVSRQARQAPARASRHAVPRRSGRDEPAHAGPAAALPRERRDPVGRRRSHQVHGGRARGRGDEPQSRRHGGQRAVPRGPAVPPPRDSRPRAAAARAQGRHPRRWWSTWRRRASRPVEILRRGAAHARAVSLAGQRPRAAERRRAGALDGQRQHGRRDASAALGAGVGRSGPAREGTPPAGGRRALPRARRRRLFVLGAHPPAVPGARHHAARHARAGAPRPRHHARQLPVAAAPVRDAGGGLQAIPELSGGPRLQCGLPGVS